MKKNGFVLVLAIFILTSILPITAKAETSYDKWSGIWKKVLSTDTTSLEGKSENGIILDFDALNVADITLIHGSAGGVFADIDEPLSMTKVDEKTFTYDTYISQLKYKVTLTLNNNDTIGYVLVNPNGDHWDYIIFRDSNFSKEYTDALNRVSKLASFMRQRDYGGFDDVANDAWYKKSVKAVFEYGIMDGVSNTAFAPDGAVSMAQAITVASRIHAQYNKKTIADAAGAWYTKYVRYATENGLMTAGAAAVDYNLPATREFMAYVFSKTVQGRDLPTVNSESIIPDETDIGSEFKNAAFLMYSSGVMTGAEGNKFNPKSNATRGQMATIIMRLLQPWQRETSDAKVDPELSANEGNVINQAPIFKQKNGDYLAFTYSGNGKEGMANLANYKALMKSKDTSTTFDGQNWGMPIYSNENYYYTYPTYGGERGNRSNYTIVKKDTKTGSSQIIYSTNSGSKSIAAITVYDNMIYFTCTERTSKEDSDNIVRLYRLNGDGKEEMLAEVKGIGFAMTAFNDCIYFDSHSSLLSYNLKTGELTDVAYYVSEWTMSEGELFYLDFGGKVYKALAKCPDVRMQMAALPYGAYRGTLNCHNGVLYIYPNYCAEFTLYICDEEGLHPLAYLGNLVINRLGIYDFGMYYEDGTDWVTATSSAGIIARENNGEIERLNLYDYFQKIS